MRPPTLQRWRACTTASGELACCRLCALKQQGAEQPRLGWRACAAAVLAAQWQVGGMAGSCSRLCNLPCHCGLTALCELACLHRWEGGAGIDFKLHGFSHKLPALAGFVFASLAGLAPQPDAFARVKEALLRNVSGGTDRASTKGVAEQLYRSCTGACLHVNPTVTAALSPPLPLPLPVQYRNVNMSPAKHATYQRLLALKNCFWHADTVLAELEQLQLADVQVGWVSMF